MTEPAHYKRGPSGAHRWLICTDSPEAEAPYPDETSDAADEGTAAHWLLEQCLLFGWSAEEAALKFDGVVPADEEEIGTLKQWPITGEMVESVQLAIDEVAKWAGFPKRKRGARLFVEERVMIPDHYGLKEPVGGTGDIIIYLMRSKTLVVLDFKYGKGHVVEVTHKELKINPQVGLYGIASLGQLERLMGQPCEVKWVVGGVIQPRAYHKKGCVRTKKLSPFQLMDLEAKLIEAVNGPRVRIAGEHCHFCRAKPDCEEFHAHRHELATGGFAAEAPASDKLGEMPEAVAAGHAGDDLPVPATKPEVPVLLDLSSMLACPVKGLSAKQLAEARKAKDHLKKWMEEVDKEVQTRLLHDIKIPGFRLGQGKGSRAYGGTPAELQTAVTTTAGKLGIENAELYAPRELKSPAQLEKQLGKGVFKETPLAALVTHKEGGPAVVPEDSDKPDYVRDNGFEAVQPAEEEKPIESPLL